MSHPYILAFESGNFSSSVALGKGDKGVALETFSLSETRNTPLICVIRDMLLQEKITPQDLSGVITTTGPGSFTGLRQSLSIAQGFRLSLSCPVVAVSSFMWVFHAFRTKGPMGIILDSKRQEPFCAILSTSGQYLKEPQCLHPEAIGSFMGTIDYYDARSRPLPSAKDLVNAFHQKDMIFEKSLTPFYVRPPDVCL